MFHRDRRFWKLEKDDIAGTMTNRFIIALFSLESTREIFCKKVRAFVFTNHDSRLSHLGIISLFNKVTADGLSIFFGTPLCQ